MVNSQPSATIGDARDLSVKLLQTSQGIARLDNDQVEILDLPYPDLQAILQSGQFATLCQPATDFSVKQEMSLTAATHLFEPLCAPQIFVIAGLNYRAHCEEIGRAVPQRLVFGTAPGTAVHVHQQPVTLPASAPHEVDYEGEIGIVIGQPASAVRAVDAWQVIAGLVPLNDVSARDVQAAGSLQAVGEAKGFPGFKPCGPCLATIDEFADPLDISICTWVNGELRQRGRSGDMVFNIPQIVEIVSRTQSLMPGDVICTGTPGGVAHGGKYPYLRDGDVVRIQLDDLPALENRFVLG